MTVNVQIKTRPKRLTGMAFPVAVDEQERDWKVVEDTRQPRMSFTTGLVHVPLDLTEEAIALRLHEMNHCRNTDPSLSERTDAPHMLVNAAEDGRINSKAFAVGLPTPHATEDELLLMAAKDTVSLAGYVACLQGTVQQDEALDVLRSKLRPDHPLIDRIMALRDTEATDQVTIDAAEAINALYDEDDEDDEDDEGESPPKDEGEGEDGEGNSEGEGKTSTEGKPKKRKGGSPSFTPPTDRVPPESWDDSESDDSDSDSDEPPLLINGLDEGTLVNNGIDGIFSDRGYTPVPWMELRIETPPLPIRLNKGQGRGRRSQTYGVVPRHPHRILTDRRMFRTKQGSISFPGTVLIDCSGSMDLEVEDVEHVIEKFPAAVVATYAGEHEENYGILRVIVKDGRRAARDLNLGRLLANGCDGPVLDWLAKQPRPRFWICDGYVTGIEDDPGDGGYCKDVCRRARIIRFESVNHFIRVTS